MSAMKTTAVEPFELRRNDGDLPAGARALGERLDRVPLATVLSKANRVAVRKGTSGAGAFTGMKPRPVDWYCFDDADNAVTDWYPQGLTSSSDAGTRGDVFVVSWYFKPKNESERGIRLSFLDAATLRYRHVLLVTAKPDGGIAPIDIHAGGVAWYGDLLYVADTGRGLRVFDTRHIYEVNGDSKTTIGRKGATYNAFGYRYVMPQTGAWAATGDARFSFASVDRTGPVHTLVGGEYVDAPGTPGRVARWPLAPDGALRTGAGGVAAAQDAYLLPEPRIQGALSHGGTWYLSQAAGSTRNGVLIVVGDTVTRRSYPVGPEDLTCVRERGTLWSVTEFARRRAVYGVPL
ncbi:hypothetical protein [Streptosporangium pseudovulgare]|uniref:Secreted protein n=1 Tax=Streptosporangium pseudovulgare TaxID=35765 RepID=A0ABQ2R3V9_9ACTN|nr:hypothetical protein [Streptosporangium pseudovulgare]GGQ07006.1 hypothetical protein GCM10010140_41510 [Streptosporangium pseudovulgare]